MLNTKPARAACNAKKIEEIAQAKCGYYLPDKARYDYPTSHLPCIFKRINGDYPIWQTAFANSSKSNSENTVDQIQQIEEETINDNHKGL